MTVNAATRAGRSYVIPPLPREESIRFTTFKYPGTPAATIVRFSQRCTNGSPLVYFRRDGKEAATWGEYPRRLADHEVEGDVQSWYAHHKTYGAVGRELWRAAVAAVAVAAADRKSGEEPIIVPSAPWWRPAQGSGQDMEAYAFMKRIYPYDETGYADDAEMGGGSRFLTVAWRHSTADPAADEPGPSREIVGYIGCKYYGGGDTVSIEILATKGASGTHGGYRDLKIGARLLRCAFNRARREKSGVQWAMVSTHTGAAAFYEKAGGFRRICATTNLIRVLRRGRTPRLPPIRRVIEVMDPSDLATSTSLTEEFLADWPPERFRGCGAALSPSSSSSSPSPLFPPLVWPEEAIREFYGEHAQPHSSGSKGK